ncbi:Npun_F0494 family protein [Calothrix sp. 336/3]|uniref:Npun_F0494 family protein n=1 Tax=Calothrix sp. 336/3 TaxID=1337936 RepID=UPI0004E3B48B|nr:Npun_F0494 family protein [Calothrix sp. 336/3]AKG23860.1 hypothetical protein IJ00_23450 [Calothrix sp. 336/3]
MSALISSSPSQEPFKYSQRTKERAERSLLCSPFQLGLFTAMCVDRVAMKEITGDTGVKNGYTKTAISELSADNALIWLTQVGVLRREVDGQGITDSFRLTPLGKQLAEELQQKGWRIPSWGDRLGEFITRWLRIPF